MKSILQPALMLSSFAAVLLASAAAHADSCTYGPCDATVCNTSGSRHANNQPCDGPATIQCSAPSCPACIYSPCSATVCNTTGSESAVNVPCIGPLTQACSAPACPPCVYSTCSAVCDGGTQFPLNAPCTGADSQSCNTQACPTAFYLRSNVGAPWGSSSNEVAMDAAIGVGSWVDERYETVDPALLFAALGFIFMEGSDVNADEMEAFIASHLSEINAYLNAGGVIFFNSAPNEGDGMGLPDGVGNSTLLTYPSFSSVASTTLPGHPIFVGPWPTSTSFTGTDFSHATISGVGLTSLLDGSSGIILAECFVGAGLAIYGGMTVTDFHDPDPDADNLRANIIAYADAIAVPEPSSSVGLSAGLVALSLCAAHRRRRRSKALGRMNYGRVSGWGHCGVTLHQRDPSGST
jgi:hypothetical protein